MICMTESFEQVSQQIISHYAKMGANKATRDYARQQVKDMELAYPDVWRDLEKKVRAEIEGKA